MPMDFEFPDSPELDEEATPVAVEEMQYGTPEEQSPSNSLMGCWVSK